MNLQQTYFAKNCNFPVLSDESNVFYLLENDPRFPTDAKNMSADDLHVLPISKPTFYMFYPKYLIFGFTYFKTDAS